VAYQRRRHRSSKISSDAERGGSSALWQHVHDISMAKYHTGNKYQRVTAANIRQRRQQASINAVRSAAGMA